MENKKKIEIEIYDVMIKSVITFDVEAGVVVIIYGSWIYTYHHKSCEFKPCSWRGILDTTLCDKVCQ